jgi:hypothetical protein
MTDYITKELAETLKELRGLIDNETRLGIWSPIMARVDASLELYEDACKTPEPVITRVEVITDTREYVHWNPYNKITTSLQDDGKTLKVFVNKTTEEPEMPITKPEFYGELIYPRDKTLYNKAETEVSDQWATALSNFIDELGGDGPALWEWEGKTPTPEKVVECLRDNIQYIADGELEACCAVMEMNEGRVSGNVLRAIRRPKPTLKSQALKDFETVRKHSDLLPEILDTIENALKSIPE